MASSKSKGKNIMQGYGMDPYAGIAQADLNEGGKWFQTNFDGEVRVQRVRPYFQSKKKGNEILFIAQCEVVASNHESHPVGDVSSYIQKMSVAPALGAVKEFMCAGVGMDPRNAEHMAQLMAPVPNAPPQPNGQPWTWMNQFIRECGQNETQNRIAGEGRVIHLMTYTKQKEKGDGVVTVHVWTPSTGQVGAPAKAAPVNHAANYPTQTPIGIMTPPAFGPQPGTFAPPQMPNAAPGMGQGAPGWPPPGVGTGMPPQAPPPLPMGPPPGMPQWPGQPQQAPGGWAPPAQQQMPGMPPLGGVPGGWPQR